MRSSGPGGFWVFVIFAVIKLLIYLFQQAARKQEVDTRLTSIRTWRPERKAEPGIQFLGAVVTPPAGKGTHCQVCGSELFQDLVTCDACATPHHRECWEYNRGCSTYGCRPKHAA